MAGDMHCAEHLDVFCSLTDFGAGSAGTDPETLDDAIAGIPDMLSRIVADIAVTILRKRGKTDEEILPFFDPDRIPEPDVCPLCGRPIEYYRTPPNGPFLVWSPAPECKNPACVRKREEAKREAAARKQQLEAERRFQSMLEDNLPIAGVPDIHRPCRLTQTGIDQNGEPLQPYRPKNGSQRRALDSVSNYRDTFDQHIRDGRGLYLCGTVGTGKSHLAASLANELPATGHPGVLYISSMDLLRSIKEAFDKSGLADRIVNTCKYASLLILDDLGKEHHSRSGWAMGVLAEIIHWREAKKRPMVVTTNFELGELEARLALSGDASSAASVVSRIGGCTEYVPVMGPDYRRAH